MAASRLPVTSTGSCHPRPPRLLIPPATPTGQHVYLTATKIWYRLKRFSGTKCHNIHVLYHLKRFLGTVCYEHGAWLRPSWRFFLVVPLQTLNASCVDAPRRRWCLWRFASLIPSGCRLPPIHKVMGNHASRGTTAAGASAVTWFLQMVISAIRCWKIAVSGPRNVVFGIFYVKN